MLFGFNGDIHGFKSILFMIANNKDKELILTHKEVRAYARCLLKIISEINIRSNAKPAIQTMLATMSLSGLPHYDRAFLAERILKLLQSEDKQEEIEEPCF